jgi:hypothetical protein
MIWHLPVDHLADRLKENDGAIGAKRAVPTRDWENIQLSYLFALLSRLGFTLFRSIIYECWIFLGRGVRRCLIARLMKTPGRRKKER